MGYSFLSFLNDLCDIKHEGPAKISEIIKKKESRWRLLASVGIVILVLVLIVNLGIRTIFIKSPIDNKKIVKRKEKIIKDLKKNNAKLNTKIVDEGVSVEFSDIYFNYNSAELTRNTMKQLNKIGNYLKKHQNYRLMVKGFTDNIGDEEYNIFLSENRAKTVQKYLIEKGFIRKDRTVFQGFGKENSIADNSTRKGRAKNRRVEIIIITE